MPLTMPTDLGWFPSSLVSGHYVTVFEVVKDPADPNWETGATANAKDRRGFWSSQDGQTLYTTLVASKKWIQLDRIESVSRITTGAGDLRSWGGIGKQARFNVTLANEDGLLESMVSGGGSATDGADNAMATGQWENRWARIGLMAHDPAGTLAYPSSIVWLACGRISVVERGVKSWRVKVSDDRMQGKLQVPRTVYQNDESVFAGFRAANNIHGQVKPWLFGHVPIAAGKVVVLGYEDGSASTLRGRRIEFYGLDESWQQKGSVTGLLFGDPQLVDPTDSRGFLQINQDTGGFIATRSPHTAMTNGQAFFFDEFNEEWLYVKMDVRLSFADTLRDTQPPVADVTDPTNAVDWANPDSFASMPSRIESVVRATSMAWVPIPWPNFGGFDMEIEGSWNDVWRDRDMQPPTPNVNLNPGMFCFLRYEAPGLMVSNGAYIIVDANAALHTAGDPNYDTNSGEGPARWFENQPTINNFNQGSRELFQMLHRDNNADGSGSSSGVIKLSTFETRLGVGRAILFGIAAPDGEGGGASAIAAGVKLYAIGIRIWGRVKFPEGDGFYAEANGYSMQAGWESWASGVVLNDTYKTPLGVAGLLLSYVLPTQGPAWIGWNIQDSFFTAHGFEVGKQLTDKVDGFTELNDLCEDGHVLMLGSSNLHPDLVAQGEGHRAVYLPKIGQAGYVFNDTGLPVDAIGYDKLVDQIPPGAMESGVVPGSVKPYKADMKDVYTKFVYKYRWNPLRQEYDGVVTISPTEWDLGEFMPNAGTWLDQTTVQATLAAAEAKYRRDPELATLTYEASWIHHGPTAEYLLAFLVQNASQPRHGVKLKTGMLPIHVRLGDVVHADLRELPDEWNSTRTDHEPSEDERLYVVAGRNVDINSGRISWDLMEVKPLERWPLVATW